MKSKKHTRRTKARRNKRTRNRRVKGGGDNDHQISSTQNNPNKFFTFKPFRDRKNTNSQSHTKSVHDPRIEDSYLEANTLDKMYPLK
jgi:hypothetical protein